MKDYINKLKFVCSKNFGSVPYLHGLCHGSTMSTVTSEYQDYGVTSAVLCETLENVVTTAGVYCH